LHTSHVNIPSGLLDLRIEVGSRVDAVAQFPQRDNVPVLLALVCPDIFLRENDLLHTSREFKLSSVCNAGDSAVFSSGIFATLTSVFEPVGSVQLTSKLTLWKKKKLY
jgi:hypothetical protein